MTEPKEKAKKDAGELSATTKSHLIEVYAYEKYGFKQDNSNKYTDKGNMCEPEGLEMISKTTGILLEKNEETFSDEYFTGTPDAIDYERQIIFDNKCSWSWLSHLKNIEEGINPDYSAQMTGYLELLGWDEGFVCHTLIDTPESIRNGEKYNLLRKMDVISEDSPQFLRAWAKKEKQLIFSNTPMEERIIIFPVTRSQELIEKLQNKVEKSRKYLQELHERHMNSNKFVLLT